MPQADVFEAPQNATFHGELLETLTEAFVGNGVLADGEAEVTADGGTAMGIDVSGAPTGIRYGGSDYTPATDSFTLSTGPTTTTGGQDDNRVDLVYFDTGTGSYAVAEGTADPNPVPPATPADGILLALVEVAHDATDIADGNILNWRARPIGGSSFTADIEFGGGLHVGENPADTISETSSPTGFTFDASIGRDVVDQIDVTLSNNSGAGATEDVTVTLYDGTSNADPQVDTETQSSVNIADGGSTTLNFLTGDNVIDDGTYYVEVTTSGTDFSVDQTDIITEGVEWRFRDTTSGTLELTNSFTGATVLSVDPITDELSLLAGAIDTAEIADAAVTSAKIAALTSGFSTSDNPGSFGALFDFTVDSNSTSGTSHSYSLAIDGTDLIQVYAESDGSGGIQNAEVRLLATTDVSGNDVVDGSTTLWDTSQGYVPRTSIDDKLVTASVSSNTTTSDEEAVLVDTSGGAVTITLASADAVDGNSILILDVGGAAGSNNITIETEGSETIDGETSTAISSNYASVAILSDGANWFTTSSVGSDLAAIFEGRESGSVSAGNQGVLVVDNLSDGETVEVYKAVLTTATVEAVASGVDLELVTFDNAGSYTSRSTLITGDGSTVFDDETGSPLASYENTSGSAQSVGVIVDNTTASAVNIVAVVEGVIA